ncbi:hypothetical protein EDB80DRAFT_713952 [Ilyonectria destructans]|nr:hypothetical protein EDB80DRAFT_713952 [Ilyonectria destructans]
MGYGQSKFVSERLLDTAARETDIPCIICRVGQIAGPTTAAGMWLKQEWLPSLIASSKYLGKLPESLGHIDTVNWIPVDLLGWRRWWEVSPCLKRRHITQQSILLASLKGWSI